MGIRPPAYEKKDKDFMTKGADFLTPLNVPTVMVGTFLISVGFALVSESQNIVCACLIIFCQLDQGPYRYFVYTLLISSVDLPLTVKNIRYFRLSFIGIGS